MDAYNFHATNSLALTLRNVGSTTVSVTSGNIFFDGQVVSGASCGTVAPSGTCTLTIVPSPTPTSGTSHLVKILTSSGGTSVMTVIAGRSG